MQSQINVWRSTSFAKLIALQLKPEFAERGSTATKEPSTTAGAVQGTYWPVFPSLLSGTPPAPTGALDDAPAVDDGPATTSALDHDPAPAAAFAGVAAAFEVVAADEKPGEADAPFGFGAAPAAGANALAG